MSQIKRDENDGFIDVIGNKWVNDPIKGYKDKSNLENIHNGLGLADIGLGIGEYSHATEEFWYSPNGKWYPMSFHGNQYVGGRNAVLEVAHTFQGIARKVFILDIATESKVASIDYEEGDYAGVLKAGLDLGMSYIGMACDF